MKNLVNKSIIHHKCHNFIGLYPKLPNLIIFGQIGYDYAGDSYFSRVGCQVYINCLGQCTLFTLGQSASATSSATAKTARQLYLTCSVYQKLQIDYNVSFTCKDYNNVNIFFQVYTGADYIC